MGVGISEKLTAEVYVTELLEKTHEQVSELPETEQNRVAKWLLAELEADQKWEQAFAESEDVLNLLADEALQAHRQVRSVVF